MFNSKINVNEKEINIRFGAFVLKKLADENIRISDLSAKISENPGDIIPKIILFGAVNASKGRRGEGFDINDIYDWIDEQEGGLLSKPVQDLIVLFFEQLNYGVPKNSQAGAEK